MDTATFINDAFVTISLLNHPFSSVFKCRDNHEVIFRKIHTYLIKMNLIKNNIIDLGAWIGDNSIPWAKNIDGIVYAIDPSHYNCDFIKQTCELNKISNVKLIQCAISNVNEVLTTNENINHCSFVYGNPGLTGKTKINAVALDFLYEARIIENIGYIHLDVEGMEYKILEGSYKIIDECRPIVSFEQHLEIDDYSKILSLFTVKNYKVFLIDEILPGCRADCRNSLAFPNEIYSELLINNIHSYLEKTILIQK